MIKYLATTIFLVGSIFLASGQSFNMTLEGTWDNPSFTYNDCWGYTDANGNEYAILGSRSRVSFIDITTPTAPSLVADFTGTFPGIAGANSVWRDFKTYDRYAYGVADQGSEGLMVFDMSDIHNGNVTKVNQLNNVFIRAHNIFIDVPEGKLYAIGPTASTTITIDIVVYDIKEDPSNPVFLSSVTVPGGYIHDAYVENNILYASSGFDGLYIFDMSVPTAPVFMSFETSTAAGFNHSGWPFDNGDKMLVAEEVPQGLKLAIFDISDLSDISFLNDFRDPIMTNVSGNVTYHNPYMVGDYAVISSYEDGITIMDLSDSNAPFRAAHYDTFVNTSYAGYEGTWGAYPYFPSGTIIGSDIVTGLYTLSTTLPLTNTCSNGIQDDFEIDIDCGGFCNTCACSAPTDMTFTNISGSSIQIDWSSVSTAVGYDVRYRPSGTTTWTVANTNTNLIMINNLTPTTTYEFQIRADCGNRDTPYATIETHTTNNCQSSETYTGSQTSGDFVTRDYILSSISAKANSEINYLTGDSIVLLPDFMIGESVTFHAQVNNPCGVAPFAVPTPNHQHTQLAIAAPETNFSVVENERAGVFYVVSNRGQEDRIPYAIYVLDDKGNILNNDVKLQARSIVKFKAESSQKIVHIMEGDHLYKFTLNK